MTRAVLFDADGVLVDSYAAYRRIWDRWSLERRLDPDIVFAATHGRRPQDTIAAVAPAMDAAREHAVLQEFLAQEKDSFPLFGGVAETLASLTVGRWGIVTSGRAEQVVWRLQSGGAPVPETIVDGTMVAHGKPDPESYLLAASRIAASPQECLVIEDAPDGIRAARAAGMRVIAVSTTHRASALSEADDCVTTFIDAMPLVWSWLTDESQSGSAS